jgi:hypothetical protein
LEHFTHGRQVDVESGSEVGELGAGGRLGASEDVGHHSR